MHSAFVSRGFGFSIADVAARSPRASKATQSHSPPSTQAEMLPVRDGTREVNPRPNGPLHVGGNMEIISGTGRVVARVTAARLCRCGGSSSKPFCDGTH